MIAISESKEKLYFYGWMCLLAIAITYSLLQQNIFFALIPLAFPIGYWIINNYKILLYLFFVTVPFSIEYNITPSLGTDLPSEPLMWLIFGVSIVILSSKLVSSDFTKYKSEITFLLLTHLIWLLFTTIFSESFYFSIKILLAKLWYIIPFYFFVIHVLKSTPDIKKLFRVGIVFLSISILIVLYKHYLLDFEFDKVNKAVSPLFRNHVNYACIIILFLPYLWALRVSEKSKTVRWLYLLSMLIFIIGIYFSYTRAAIISMILCYPVYYIVKARLIKPILIVVSFLAIIGIGYLSIDNNYLILTPDYNKTITHQEFGNLLSATAKGEDISTMERVYRWVAGVQMIKDKPILGFGPGTFYTFYKGYTVSSFETYVSNNPDHSTVHNYFLLTFIEQGVIGFIIFILLCISVLIKGEEVYHKTVEKNDKVIVMAAIMSFIVILLLNLINDMIETDKVGPFFFLSMGIIMIYNNRIRKERKLIS